MLTATALRTSRPPELASWLQGSTPPSTPSGLREGASAVRGQEPRSPGHLALLEQLDLAAEAGNLQAAQGRS